MVFFLYTSETYWKYFLATPAEESPVVTFTPIANYLAIIRAPFSRSTLLNSHRESDLTYYVERLVGFRFASAWRHKTFIYLTLTLLSHLRRNLIRGCYPDLRHTTPRSISRQLSAERSLQHEIAPLPLAHPCGSRSCLSAAFQRRLFPWQRNTYYGRPASGPPNATSRDGLGRNRG
jgi:hypothetical protein